MRFSNRDLGLAYFCWSEWCTFMVLWGSACVPLVQNNGYNNAFFGWLFSLGYVSHFADIEERQQELLFGPERIVTNPKSTEIVRSLFYLGSCHMCLRSIFYLTLPITKFVRDKPWKKDLNRQKGNSFLWLTNVTQLHFGKISWVLVLALGKRRVSQRLALTVHEKNCTCTVMKRTYYQASG